MMALNFVHTKSNMEGLDAGQKQHIYANPKMPEICGVLSTGKYLAAFPTKAAGRLFGSQHQYDRFCKMLKDFLEKHKGEVMWMGIDPNSICVHLIQKGAATYCCSRTIRGHPMRQFATKQVSTILSESLPNLVIPFSLLTRICIVGHTVADLDVCSHDFAISPPHFVPSLEEDEEDEVDKCMVMLFPSMPDN
jgi:hypothetical protein